MKYKIGDILVLKNHPFFTNQTNITLQGDASFTPPLMIVIEVLNDYKFLNDKSEYDEGTGFIKPNPNQVRCLFYSHKTHKFESSNWFPTFQLRKVDIETDTIKETDTKELLGKSVILRTWKTEIDKKKSTLKQSSFSGNKENTVTTAHLSFLPPVMTIIGFKKAEDIKESNYDKKTGNKKREISNFQLKCKWFNPQTDSFSEDFFPVEALTILPEIDTSIIEKLAEMQYFVFENETKRLLAKPLELFFNHCYYELRYFDFISNLEERIEVTKLVGNVTPVGSFFTEIFPKIEVEQNDNDATIKAKITKQKYKEFEKSDGKYFRMKYEDSNKNITTRTICNISKINELYFKADCKLRNAERIFRYDGVLQVEILRF